MARTAVALGFTLLIALGGAVWAAQEPSKPAVDLDARFKALDVDGDGKLSPEEFKKLPEEPKRDGGRRGNLDPERLKKLRERLGNRGGQADPEKLKKLRERFGSRRGADKTEEPQEKS